MSAAVIIPVKSFDLAKGRLADSLSPDERARLARTMAGTVIAAAHELDVYVVCDDDDVASFVADLGAAVVWKPARGLNHAVRDGIEAALADGHDRAIVAHADLPRARDLRWLASTGDDDIVIVTDRRSDGTNVMSLPLGIEFDFHYGPGSADAHRAEADRRGLRLAIVHDDDLGWDVDVPDDLAVFDTITDTDASQHPTDDQDPNMAEAQNPLTPAPVRMTVTSTDLPTPERALAIGAHPDDVDFGCGATLAKWAADGCEVHVLVCTDGSKGTWDPNADETELIATRQVEQRAAAAALGATGQVGFLGWSDGELESTLVQREQVARFIRETRPNVVLGHDPWKRHRLHPDHRNAGWLTTDGIVAARDPKFFPDQGLPHHRPDRLLLWEADEPDHLENVTGFLDTKFAALMAHESQFESTMKTGPDATANSPEMAAFRDRIEGRLRAAGAAGGVEHAEVFKLIDDL